MKIDYELAEKIGATHYRNGGDYYKISNQELLCYSSNREWRLSILSPARVAEDVKPIPPIPPKPPVRVEYEKVEFEPEEIWKAFKEHQEDGHLFVANKDEYECLGDGIFELAMAISQGDQLYRRVEKPVDWRDEVIKYLKSKDYLMSRVPINTKLTMPIEINQNFVGEEFLEMCRVALRANGEL